MGNMSYTMFENTSSDLQDCVDKLNEIDSFNELSKSEKNHAEFMYDLCVEYLRRWEEVELTDCKRGFEQLESND